MREGRIEGQRPTSLPWKINPGNQRRDISEVMELLREYDVILPDDIEIVVEENDELYGTLDDLHVGRTVLTAKLPWLGEDRYGMVHFDELYNAYGKIPICLNPAMLLRDEAILAVVIHELAELEYFRQVFKIKNGSMPFQDFADQARSGLRDNFHSQAWDEADRFVLKAREKRDV